MKIILTNVLASGTAVGFIGTEGLTLGQAAELGIKGFAPITLDVLVRFGLTFTDHYETKAHLIIAKAYNGQVAIELSEHDIDLAHLLRQIENSSNITKVA